MQKKQVNPDLLRRVMNLDLQKVKERLVKSKVKEVIAETAIRKFKQFLYLAGTQKQQLVPTRAISEVWHEYLMFTKDYYESCHSLFGKLIHHQPLTEAIELNKAFNFTAKVYKDQFGEDYEDISLRAYCHDDNNLDCCSTK